MHDFDAIKHFDLKFAGKPDFIISESMKYRSIFLEQID